MDIYSNNIHGSVSYYQNFDLLKLKKKKKNLLDLTLQGTSSEDLVSYFCIANPISSHL